MHLHHSNTIVESTFMLFLDVPELGDIRLNTQVVKKNHVEHGYENLVQVECGGLIERVF